MFGASGFTAPGGAMNLQLGAGITLVWIVGLVVWAVRELGERTRAAEEPTPAASAG